MLILGNDAGRRAVRWSPSFLLSILSSLGFIKKQGRRKMAEPRDTIEIVNVVGSTGIGQEMNLKQLTLALEGADYDPGRFPGLVYRTSNPKTAALLFRSGKIVCTGAKSIDALHKGVEHVFQSLRTVSYTHLTLPTIYSV